MRGFRRLSCVVPRRDGFTLIEVLAALVLAGLLAAVAVASLAGPASAARMEDQVERLIAFDAAARRAGGTVERDRDTLRAGEATLRLDRGFTIASTVPDDGIVITGGRSADYAVELVGGGASRWVVFLGMTGRAVEVEDGVAAREALELGGGG